MRILIFIALAFFACKSTPKENPALKEAADVHQQATDIEKAIAPQMDELTQLKNSLSVQGRTLTPDEQTLLSQIQSIAASYEYWEENHVEVPGYNLDHTGHEGHDHGKTNLDLSPQDMIAVQREFRDSIVSIQQRVNTVLQLAKSIQ